MENFLRNIRSRYAEGACPRRCWRACWWTRGRGCSYSGVARTVRFSRCAEAISRASALRVRPVPQVCCRRASRAAPTASLDEELDNNDPLNPERQRIRSASGRRSAVWRRWGRALDRTRAHCPRVLRGPPVQCFAHVLCAGARCVRDGLDGPDRASCMPVPYLPKLGVVSSCSAHAPTAGCPP